MMRLLLFTLLLCFCLLNSCGQESPGYRQQEEQDRSVQEIEDPMQVAEKAAPKSLEKNIQEQEEVEVVEEREEVEIEKLRRPHPEVTREKLRNAPIDSAEKVIRVECDCPQSDAQMQQTTPAEGSKAPTPETRQEQEEENSDPKLPGRRPQLPPGYDNSSYKPI
jgi:Zn-finger protein